MKGIPSGILARKISADPVVVLHGIPHCARAGSERVHVKYFCCCSVVNAMKF